jgi:hypothetical protein
LERAAQLWQAGLRDGRTQPSGTMGPRR